ncbi:cysteine synthase A [Candidatus Poribacteria bacterium]|nr:cysteine synthase A [Candidatus Poribacteria bacterium]MBT5533933.1 cysteine synthase A [Candidatus Poribacteria bacterium]MBT5714373.1 cysteine synthase A [Candidatus Poribacteria bacterium]MBT7097554.1 cysteine synthase A [Candidatus Poribacteria bacterium]MBT7804883.1 cysteine synthase A [Candidatus Poribacteria bacterium]
MERKACGSVLELIGATPLVRLNRIPGADSAEIYGKLESSNPGGSVKDRIGLAMVLDAEKRGVISEGATIVEPTAGNTGTALAIVAKARGYSAILTMPENVTSEKCDLLKAFGAELVLTPEAEGMAGAIWEAEAIARRTENSFMPNQFVNPANPAVHRQTTGPEILAQTQENIDAFVAGVGTGGTLTGVAQAMKTRLPDARIVAVEPAASPVLSGGKPGPTRIDGLGAGFVPDVLDMSLVDEVITVSEEDAYAMMRFLGEEEGLLVGMSSGANAVAASRVASRMEPGQRVVTILADTGDRYFSLAGHFG